MDREEFDNLVLQEQETILHRLHSQECPAISARFLIASSTQLPLADETIDAILTSPPYLTRIDYAVAYSRELAITGIDIRNRAFRGKLMGTTLIRPHSQTSVTYGPLAQDLISRVTKHTSHASADYYLKQFKQYLDDLVRSLNEVARVARHGAAMIMVLQDSYYKEVPVRLASICVEEATRVGWKITDSEPFEVSRILTTLNSAAQAYPKGKVAETVLTLKRGPRQ